MNTATVGGETYQVVGTASLADLETAQVVVPGTGATATAAQLHYITDDGQTAAAEWFVVQECPQVGGHPGGGGADRPRRMVELVVKQCRLKL